MWVDKKRLSEKPGQRVLEAQYSQLSVHRSTLDDEMVISCLSYPEKSDIQSTSLGCALSQLSGTVRG